MSHEVCKKGGVPQRISPWKKCPRLWMVTGGLAPFEAAIYAAHIGKPWQTTYAHVAKSCQIKPVQLIEAARVGE